MIDSSTSPIPAWKRYATMILLGILVLVAGYVIYTKEIHPSSAGSSAGSPPATSPAPAPAKSKTTGFSSPVPTTLPGGVPVSSRNPFAA